MAISPRTNSREVVATEGILADELAQIAVVKGLQAQIERLAEIRRAIQEELNEYSRRTREKIDSLQYVERVADRQFEAASPGVARIIRPRKGYRFAVRFEAGQEVIRGTYRKHDETMYYQTGLVDKVRQNTGEDGATFVADYLEYDDMAQPIAVSMDRTEAWMLPIKEDSDGIHIVGVTMEPIPNQL